MVQDETTIPLWKEKSLEDNSSENEWKDNYTEEYSAKTSQWQKFADRLNVEWQKITNTIG